MSYTSLKDLYSEQVIGKEVPPLPRQAVRESADPVKTFAPGNEYVPQTPWSEFNLSSDLFNERKEGSGRGEYSVACILWGLNSKEQVDNSPAKIIQGGAVSFDVLGPDGRQYEVKELSEPVRTGTEGKVVLSEIVNATIQMLDTILNAFSTMDAHGKQTVNNKLLNSNVVKETILNTKNKKHFESIKDAWSLDEYLKDVKQKAIRELSRGILLSPVINLAYYVPKGRPHVIFSLRQLINALNEIATDPVTMTGISGELNTAVKDLVDTIHKHYKVHGDDKEKEFFEKEAENIDRDLTQKQCKLFQKCTDESSFNKIIRAINLNETLNNIVVLTKNVVEKLFPGAGLFAVDNQGFRYIPKAKLNDYIEFETISSGAVKIREKK